MMATSRLRHMYIPHAHVHRWAAEFAPQLKGFA
eukprot:CAMPEP_0115886844 /NCGR_PEP_ID=MMETSP0287-20121206/31432_1 /TAXON_ID=412157 /ORGANISM="Chrysochromulina rotalis, Strain UIO044" /LENGTH=32 /DNA_ID= /DNA_START= /DNA_END= /DNA_ORIENTATION=